MKLARILAWCLFAVWATWLFALGAALENGSAIAHWIPDLGLVLTLSLLARAEVHDVPVIAFAAALARSATSSEPPLVLFAGLFAILLIVLLARSAIELSGPIGRTIASGFFVFAFDAWLVLARHVREPVHGLDLGLDLGLPWATLVCCSLSSALLALVAGPWLVHLPGLTPLRSRSW